MPVNCMLMISFRVDELFSLCKLIQLIQFNESRSGREQLENMDESQITERYVFVIQ